MFEKRKQDHIRFSLDSESQSHAQSDWDALKLIPEALPEMNFEDVTLEVSSLDQVWRTPFFISSMTAGHEGSLKLNHILAEASQHKGWMMGVGSQRRELDDPDYSNEWREIKKSFPKVQLVSNLGLSQLINTPVDQIKKIIESTESLGIFIHLNTLQECLQMEGTPHFKGGVLALKKLVDELKHIPVIVKEVGSGISSMTISRLKDIGVRAVDVSGRGGTHWGRVEGLRATLGSRQSHAALVFKDWGLSTPEALLQYYLAEKKSEGLNSNQLELFQQESYFEIWASGGVKNGLMAAKALALGAQRVGLAHSVLQAAQKGTDEIIHFMDQIEYELRIALFCLGIRSINELKQRKVWKWERE